VTYLIVVPRQEGTGVSGDWIKVHVVRAHLSRAPPMWAHATWMFAVKPRAGGTQAFERSCSDPSDEHESGFYGIAQLVVVPISDIMST